MGRYDGGVPLWRVSKWRQSAERLPPLPRHGETSEGKKWSEWIWIYKRTQMANKTCQFKPSMTIEVCSQNEFSLWCIFEYRTACLNILGLLFVTNIFWQSSWISKSKKETPLSLQSSTIPHCPNKHYIVQSNRKSLFCACFQRTSFGLCFSSSIDFR